MAISPQRFVVCLALLAPPAALALWPPASAAQPAQMASTQALRARQQQLFELANQARAAAGVGPLAWDEALAAAALSHCLRMAAEGEIAHQYGGEPDVSQRAGQAGAHFSLIEENVALGSYAAAIHQGWMQSPHHRANLLNPEVDRVGIAVVSGGGVLYAVADYAHAVLALSRAQVEATVAALVRARGVAIEQDASAARAYCSNGSKGQNRPGFFMLWQGAEVDVLPQALLDKLATGRYGKAEVGSCPAQEAQGSFTAFRVAVILYGAPAGPRPFY